MIKILEVRDLAVNYGQIEAVRGINIEVKAGEIVTLLGSNGAGKTTTVKAIMGLLPPTQGTVIFAGQPLDKQATHHRLKRGITLVPEGRKLFPRLTVRENILMGAYSRGDKSGLTQELEGIYEMFPVLKERLGQSAGTLSGGEQQMLTIARALMSKPKMILFDEPSLGLAPIFIKEIMKLIKRINSEGTTVLLIEQNTKLALETAHRGYVLEKGKITLSGTSNELLNNPLVQKAYLGGEHGG